MRHLSRFTEKQALALTLCWVAGLALVGSTDALLFLAPALLIAIPLLGGRYIGEELIVKMVERRDSSTRRPQAAPVPSLFSTPDSWRPRGARLIAFSLAKRPPPLRLIPQN